jgi:hypothetical protein
MDRNYNFVGNKEFCGATVAFKGAEKEKKGILSAP